MTLILPKQLSLGFKAAEHTRNSAASDEIRCDGSSPLLRFMVDVPETCIGPAINTAMTDELTHSIRDLAAQVASGRS